MIYLPPDLDATERLWSMADGTMCVLTACEAPPRYAVSLVRNGQVLRQKRVYGEAAARVLAEDGRQSVGGRPEPPERRS